MNPKELNHRFSFHPAVDLGVKEAHEFIRNTLLQTALLLNQIVPDGREKSLMITHLEETMYWGNAGIARSGLLHAPVGSTAWNEFKENRESRDDV